MEIPDSSRLHNNDNGLIFPEIKGVVICNGINYLLVISAIKRLKKM